VVGKSVISMATEWTKSFKYHLWIQCANTYY